MFCDLVGSTRISAILDPEEFRDLLLDYQKLCSGIVSEYDGYIARYIGDGILIYFGYPKADETDAERALSCALKIQEYAKHSPSNIPGVDVGVPIRIGIDTGLVVIGDIGDERHRQDMIAIGETPHIAARLQESSAAGDITISHTTYRLVSQLFSFSPTEPLDLKGISRKFQAYKVLGKKPYRNSFGRVDSDSTKFVGRETEISKLGLGWDKVCKGNCSKLIVVGESGIGKSRLIAEFQRAFNITRPSTIELCCSKLHVNLPFYPIIDWLHQEISISRYPDQAPRTLIENFLDRIGLDKNTHLAPLSALLIEDDASQESYIAPNEQHLRVIQSLVAIIRNASVKSPLLLVVEDSQWADPSTLELLDTILTLLSAQPILLLVTSRTPGSKVSQNADSAEVVALKRLSDASMAQIARSVLDLPEGGNRVVNHIVEKSDGVPYFCEEIAKAVHHSHSGFKQPDQPIESVLVDIEAIPTTLRDSLAARLDRLGGHKWIVEVAAVIGRRFEKGLMLAILERISGKPAAELKKTINALQDMEIFSKPGIDPQDDKISFYHALLQETAYSSLVRAEKKKYHKVVAQEMASGAFSSEPATLAMHYRESELFVEAIEHFNTAAERASFKGSCSEALALVSEAFGILPKLTSKESDKLIPKLATTMGIATMVLEGFGVRKAEDAYQMALQACKNAPNAEYEFRSLWGLSRYCMVSSKLEQGLGHAERAFSIAKEADNSDLQLEAHLIIGVANLWLGNFKDALSNYTSAREKYAEESNYVLSRLCGEHPMVSCHSRMSFPLWVLGFPEQALQACGQARTIAEQVANPLSMIRALAFSGWINQFIGDADKTLFYARHVVDLANKHSYPFWKHCGNMQIGWAKFTQGNIGGGIRQYKQALDASKATGTIGRTYHRGLLAEMYLKTSETDKAGAALRDAFDTAKKSGDGFWSASLHRIWGEYLCHNNKVSEGSNALLASSTMAREQKAVFYEIQSHIGIIRYSNDDNAKVNSLDALKHAYLNIQEGIDTAIPQEAHSVINQYS